jgi:hypothetical protein
MSADGLSKWSTALSYAPSKSAGIVKPMVAVVDGAHSFASKLSRLMTAPVLVLTGDQGQEYLWLHPAICNGSMVLQHCDLVGMKFRLAATGSLAIVAGTGRKFKGRQGSLAATSSLLEVTGSD